MTERLVTDAEAEEMGKTATVYGDCGRERLLATREALKAMVDQLSHPFGKQEDLEWTARMPDEAEIGGSVTTTYGDLRKARALLAELQGESP